MVIKIKTILMITVVIMIEDDTSNYNCYNNHRIRTNSRTIISFQNISKTFSESHYENFENHEAHLSIAF